MSDYLGASTTIDSTNHVMNWDTDGYYVVGDEEWQDIILETKMVYKGGAIGIAPRVYADNMYMTFKIENDDVGGSLTGHASLEVQVTQDTIGLGSINVDPLILDNTHTIRVEIKRSNYKIFLDEKKIFDIEYASMPRGKVGVYATSGNQCTEIKVDALFSDTWTTNAGTIIDGIASIRELENKDKYLYLAKSQGNNTLYAEQLVSVESGAHTLSFNVEGSGTVEILEQNGAAPSSYSMTIPATAEWTKMTMTRTIKSDCTLVKVRFSVVSTELKVNEIQLEPKPFATDYIHNENTVDSITRESSFITYPSKANIDIENGTVSMWVKPTITHDSTMTPTLFEYGTADGVIRLSYEGDAVQFRYGADENNFISIPTSFLENIWYHLVAKWSQNEISLYVNNTKAINGDIDYVMNVQSDIIRFGHSYINPDNVFLGVIDETIVFKNQITDEDVEELFLAEEPIDNKNGMILRATFNYSIGNFNKSSIEATLAPAYGSPVVVEKEDGTVMQKVSFFDVKTGDYRTYNEEQIIYDGESDYLEISFYNIDTESFPITVRDEEGAIWGDPYEVTGNRVYVTLTDDEKDKLYGQALYVSYQIENSYTVDFNIDVADSFRINIGKHDGQSLKVIYEGNDFTNEKLATMIEMNPLLNSNHEGFLYITRNIEKISSFRAKATPEDLHANGVSESLVVIEPLDQNGNFISHAKLEVTAFKGTIIPNYDRGSILSRERSGRYIYKYRAPKLYQRDEKKLEVLDYINILDKETGLGVQVPVTLRTIKVIGHIISPTDTLDSIADMYGTTTTEILIENQMDGIAMSDYLSNNVGTAINVPESYIEGIMTRSTEELAEEKRIIDIVDKLMEYMGDSIELIPTELASILDFNGDGIINADEFTWINDNKGKNILKNKHDELTTWLKNNAG